MAIKRAKTSFGLMNNVGGRVTPQVVREGDLYDESDFVVERFPNNFEDVDVHVTQRREAKAEAVEAATAAPGERRTRTQPKQSRTTRSRAKKAEEDEARRQEEERQAQELKAADPDDPDNA